MPRRFWPRRKRRAEGPPVVSSSSPRTGFALASAGFVGRSDGSQDLATDNRLDWRYGRAERGNVALTAELVEPRGVVALGFAPSVAGARTQALGSLADGFDAARASFVDACEAWGRDLDFRAPTPELRRAACFAATVIKVHEDRTFPGAIVASLSVPWGNTGDSAGGYHLVWPRDCVMSAFALIAAGLVEDARRVLSHLVATQLPDGRWSQNHYPDGQPFWTAEQLDEIAFPILLAGERGHLAFAAGEDALPYVAAMQSGASATGLLPEQVWDADDLPENGLFRGRPSGSAMPLVWAHAELLKLVCAMENGVPVERLRAVAERYGSERPAASAWFWRDDIQTDALPAGRDLVIEAERPFALHFGFDGWQDVAECEAGQRPFGLYGVRFAGGRLAGRRTLDFTRRFAGGWEGRDHEVLLGSGRQMGVAPTLQRTI